MMKNQNGVIWIQEQIMLRIYSNLKFENLKNFNLKKLFISNSS